MERVTREPERLVRPGFVEGCGGYEAHVAPVALKLGQISDSCMYFETRQGSALSANHPGGLTVAQAATRLCPPLPSENLHCGTHHFVVDIDVTLSGRKMPVAGEHHDSLRRDACVSQPGDEPASATMA